LRKRFDITFTRISYLEWMASQHVIRVFKMFD